MLQLLKRENTKYLADGLTNSEQLRKNYYLKGHYKRKKNSKRQLILMVIVLFGYISSTSVQETKTKSIPIMKKNSFDLTQMP